jgi:hypothetical protein
MTPMMISCNVKSDLSLPGATATDPKVADGRATAFARTTRPGGSTFSDLNFNQNSDEKKTRLVRPGQ